MAHDDGAKSVHMACEDAESVPETGVLIIMHQNEVRYHGPVTDGSVTDREHESVRYK